MTTTLRLLPLLLAALMMAVPGAHGIDALDVSALPTEVISETQGTLKAGDLLHRTEAFKAGDKVVMLRDTWLMADGKTVVRTGHRLVLEGRDVIVIYDFNDSPHHAEHHSSLTHFLPKGARLMTSQGDAVSPPEWRITGADNRVLASYVRGQDGLIVPRTRADFEADMKEREAKLARK